MIITERLLGSDSCSQSSIFQACSLGLDLVCRLFSRLWALKGQDISPDPWSSEWHLVRIIVIVIIVVVMIIINNNKNNSNNNSNSNRNNSNSNINNPCTLANVPHFARVPHSSARPIHRANVHLSQYIYIYIYIYIYTHTWLYVCIYIYIYPEVIALSLAQVPMGWRFARARHWIRIPYQGLAAGEQIIINKRE